MQIVRWRKAPETGRENGYSLSELLIVIALMGLMILFSGPAIADSFRAYQVRASANEVTTILRALRYNAVTNRVARTLTINDENDGTNPNSYSYINHKGDPVLVRLHAGVALEGASVSSITIGLDGGTGQTSTQTVLVSRVINGDRGDRYTVSVTPTGTVSSAYSTYTP